MKNQFQPLRIIAPAAVKAALKQSELLQKHSAYPQVIKPDVQIIITVHALLPLLRRSGLKRWPMSAMSEKRTFKK